MVKPMQITHVFVDEIPSAVEAGVIYVSLKYATAVHLCACGCRNEIVTPISPTDWKITFDGVSISLDPSIGSWNLPCASHYWIMNDRIEWSGRWSKTRIKASRQRDELAKRQYYGSLRDKSDKDT